MNVNRQKTPDSMLVQVDSKQHLQSRAGWWRLPYNIYIVHQQPRDTHPLIIRRRASITDRELFSSINN